MKSSDWCGIQERKFKRRKWWGRFLLLHLFLPLLLLMLFGSKRDVVDDVRVFLVLLQHQLIRLHSLTTNTHTHKPGDAWSAVAATQSTHNTAAPSLDDLSRKRQLRSRNGLGNTGCSSTSFLTAARYRKGWGHGRKRGERTFSHSLTCMYMKQNPLSARSLPLSLLQEQIECDEFSLTAMKTGSILNNGQKRFVHSSPIALFSTPALTILYAACSFLMSSSLPLLLLLVSYFGGITTLLESALLGQKCCRILSSSSSTRDASGSTAEQDVISSVSCWK